MKGLRNLAKVCLKACECLRRLAKACEGLQRFANHFLLGAEPRIRNWLLPVVCTKVSAALLVQLSTFARVAFVAILFTVIVDHAVRFVHKFLVLHRCIIKSHAILGTHVAHRRSLCDLMTHTRDDVWLSFINIFLGQFASATVIPTTAISD